MLLSVPACQTASEPEAENTSKTTVYVLGTLHGAHRTSSSYPLDVFEKALRRAKPDILLTEIPPDRVEEALASYRDTGKVTEERTLAFPEYTDVAIPLAEEIGYQIVGTSGWTSEMARDRRENLAQIRSDPAWAGQWAEHQAAQRKYSDAVKGRFDDPLFLHSAAYDELAEISRGPYQKHFDDDLGPGGWTQINAAHISLINQTLDTISGQGKVAVVTFGALHKYMILNSLRQRKDVHLADAKELFE